MEDDPDLRSVSYPIGDRSIHVLHDTALWNQMWPYNELVVAHNGDIAGIPTGCTATAMAIKFRFHSWPHVGNSSHSYSDSEGGVQYPHTVDYWATTYSWQSMPTNDLTTANDDVAELMYHCGVAVDMDYEVGGSGAWPSASATNTYFRYRGTESHGSSHDNRIIASVRAGLPVVCSSSAHTVLIDGYRDSPYPYFHVNCGWGGSNNGWYDLGSGFPGSDGSIDRSYPYSAPSNFTFVDGSWSGSENGNLQTPFNTVGEGAANTASGGHLRVRAGSYNEGPLTIADPMTISTYEGTAVIE
jgi:hypothetical protein